MSGEAEEAQTEQFVYRVSTAKEWDELQRTGETLGGDIDRSTGCIHLSSLHQVKMVLNNYFQGRDDLFLLQVDTTKIGDGLAYEAVEMNIFPHLYGPSRSFIPLSLYYVSNYEKLELIEDGKTKERCCTCNMGRQKKGVAPATWENEITFIYCDFCIKEIELENRPTTHFSKKEWRNLTKNFNKCTGRTYDRTLLKNKWDQLKKDWKLLKDLMHGETCIGWNLLKKMIDTSNEWWNEKIQAIPATKKFHYNGVMPELEEKLDRMFSRVVAIGEDVWIPNSGVLPPELRELQRESFVDEECPEDEPNTNPTNGI